MAEERVQPPPPSPGLSPIQLDNCIEHLLHFILKCSIDETLEVDLGFSKHYCSDLLSHDPIYRIPNTTDISEGVPSYPLYKHFASALFRSISSGSICKTVNNLTLINEDDSLKQKEKVWNKLLLEKGSDLVNSVDFELHVQEPFFSQLKDGLKTIEGRCAVGDYNRIGSGALILFNKCLLLQVQEIRRYASFYEMLEAEGLSKVLPGVETVEEGVQIYRKFYSEEKESLNGVVAICVTKPASQIYLYLATIVSGLSCEGIQRLLGLAHTVGTVSDALTPPRSTLLSSFLLPHNPNVRGAKLTDGARALTKHLNRSSDGYWGTLSGSDSDKNRVALDVINRMIAHCCWLNIHIVPPHGVVFEIRVSDGYGARWSQDGTKFIGFLEPYMEDGHLRSTGTGTSTQTGTGPVRRYGKTQKTVGTGKTSTSGASSSISGATSG